MRRQVTIASVIAITAVTLSVVGSTVRRADATASSTTVAASKIIPGNTQSFSITVAKVVRTYSVFLPKGLPASGKIPLLIGLHGAAGSGTEFELGSGFDDIATRKKFMVVYPDGLYQTWNAGSCCGGAQMSNIDDVGFISAVIDEMVKSFRVDKNKTYVAGHSNGGMMAYRLACDLSAKVAAVGLQSGTLVSKTCTPKLPVPLLHIHGTADSVVAINGGNFFGYIFPAARDSLNKYSNSIGCRSTPTTKGYAGKTGVSVVEWTGCRKKSRIKYEIVQGASHSWMGKSNDTSSSQLINTSEEIWSFVSQFSR